MNRLIRTCVVPLVAGVLVVAAGCSKSDTTSTSTGTTATSAPAKAAVTVSDPWARESPAGVSDGAAYMTLTSSTGDKLLSASVPASVAAKAELHETVTGSDEPMGSTPATGMSTSPNGPVLAVPVAYAHEGGETGSTMPGEMSMRPVASIDLPAGQAVQLKPGGYHIMLIDLAAPLATGTEITITLTFEKAGTQQVVTPVREG